MGAAGDMLLAALLELHPDPGGMIDRINNIGIPGVVVSASPSVKCGIAGTHVSVEINGAQEGSIDAEIFEDYSHDHSNEHGHSHDHTNGHSHNNEHGHDYNHSHDDSHEHIHIGMAQIEGLINSLDVSSHVKENAVSVYSMLAEAESAAHGQPVEMVHFHEVGMMDAVADIVGVCMLMEEFAPARVFVSNVHVGSGQVKCSHGILPVPAPATAYLLKGVPTYGGQIKGELCTPTGAALLKRFGDEFGNMPNISVDAIGYGMGTKDFPVANCVRAFLGQVKSEESDVVEIICNLDDMTGEELGFALETLMENGALDVYIVPVSMKKSRPGHMLVCLAKPGDEERLAKLVLKHTTSFGVRIRDLRRLTLERDITTVKTGKGVVRVKRGYGYGVSKSKAEYEDLAKLARESGSSIFEAKQGNVQNS